MIPLFHDLAGERVVVFGGGQVATRKAERFASEAEVIVASIEFHDRLFELPCELLRVAVDVDVAARLAGDAFLAIPATDDEALNDRIAERLLEEPVLVNRVDGPGEVITPSLVDGEHVQVAIATGGASPSVSRHLRQQIEPLVEAADPMVELQDRLRTDADELFEAERRRFLRAVLAEESVWDALENDDHEQAYERAMVHYPGGRR